VKKIIIMKLFLKPSIFIIFLMLTKSICQGMTYPLSQSISFLKFHTGIKPNPFQKDKLIDIYTSLDESILKSGNEKAVKAYLVDKNMQILNYLHTNYPESGTIDGTNDIISINDEDFIVFGLVYALAEYGGYLQSGVAKAAEIPGWIQCIGGVLGVGAMYELISGAATATYASTWKIIKKIAKRYAGWLGVGLALWEIATECF
jgi:hypothetical protein